MKTNFCQRQNQFVRFRIPATKQHCYQMAICLAAMACCGMAAAQTNSPPGDMSAINSVTLTNVTKLEDVTVIGNLDRARSSIMTETGSTAYGINKDQIQNVSQGD